jgi:hypothetical protein
MLSPQHKAVERSSALAVSTDAQYDAAQPELAAGLIVKYRQAPIGEYSLS